LDSHGRLRISSGRSAAGGNRQGKRQHARQKQRPTYLAVSFHGVSSSLEGWVGGRIFVLDWNVMKIRRSSWSMNVAAFQIQQITIYRTVQSRIRDPAMIRASNPPDCESGWTRTLEIMIY
jgi:hypothetical protein